MTTYRTTLLEQAAQLILMLGGSEKVAVLLNGRKGANFKFGQIDFGQLEAILNKIVKTAGGDEKAIEQLLGGESEIQLIKAVKKLFNQHGHRIPPQGMKAAHTDPNRSFNLIQPALETVDTLALRLVRSQEAFQPEPIMMAADFQGKVHELLAALRADEQIANLTDSVCLPIILPQIEQKDFDYGRTLGQVFVVAAKKAYEKEFPGRPFNYRQDDLAGHVTIIDESHRRLVERLFQSHLIALYFPNPLQGFSVHAQREQMESLPTTLHLAGGLDILSAVTMYPDVLGRDSNTPGLDMAALEWRDAASSLNFEAHDGYAGFDDRTHLGNAGGRYSGGLVFCLP